MPIVASDLIVLGALNRPEDDAGTSGGGIDVDHRPVFTALAANDEVEAVSDNAADTMNLTITGRDPGGAVVSETKALTGTTPVVFSSLGTIERILKVVLASDAAGVITVRRDGAAGDIGVIPAGERGFYRMFINSVSGASPETRFEKIFAKNNHGTLTLTSATVELTADPADRIRIGLETSKDGTGSVANRKATPGGITFVDDSVSQAVPTDQLDAGEAIGVWIEQALTAADSPKKNSFTIETAGQTT